MRTKNKMKNYLKLGILLFGVFFFLTNCRDEYISEKEKIEELSFKRTSLKQLTKLKPIIKNVKKIKPKGITSKTFDDFLNLDSLNVDEVIQITDLNGNSTYTFKIENNTNNHNFENLHLIEIENGYIGYILSYEPNTEWLNNCYDQYGNLILDMENYQGDITKYSLNREIIWTTKQSNNKSSGQWVEECTFSLVPVYNIICYVHWEYGCCSRSVITGYNSVQSCETVYSPGGPGSGNDNENEENNNPGGSGENQTEPCSPISGTLISNNQPISGISKDCATNNTISIQPDAEGEGRRRECKKLKAILEDSIYMEKIRNLKNLDGLEYETTVTRTVDGSINEYQGAPNSTSVVVPTQPTSKYNAVSHVHNEKDTITTYSVPSVSDLGWIAERYREGFLDSRKFVAFLATADDTYYAITINNISKLKKFWDYKKMHDASLPQAERNALFNKFVLKSALMEEYFLHETNAKIKKTTNSIISEKLLMEFLDKADMGFTVFRTDEDFETFNKIEINNQGIVETLEPCK